MSATRPKPWESSSTVPATQATVSSQPQGPAPAVPTEASTATTSSSAVPPVPSRTGLGAVDTSQVPGVNGFGTNSGYGSYGMNSGYGTGYGSYGSGYGNYGSYGGGMGGYGSYGGYGTGYGSYGSYGMGGYGGYGRYGAGGMPMGGAGPGGALQNSTAATFQLIESIVNAFGGFAQMLESTYMATHSSFFAMMSVAEQVGHLKQSLGSILGIFAIMRWGRALLAKLTGKSVPSAAASSLTPANFAKFQARGGPGGAPVARPSFKPLILFLGAVFGLPYLLGKMIRTMANNQPQLGPQGEILDPSQLEFCRALYDFVPENPQVELEMKRGDLFAVLASTDPSGQRSEWWRVRSRDGKSGYVPASYVEVIPRQTQQLLTEGPASPQPLALTPNAFEQDTKPKAS